MIDKRNNYSIIKSMSKTENKSLNSFIGGINEVIKHLMKKISINIKQ